MKWENSVSFLRHYKNVYQKVQSHEIFEPFYCVLAKGGKDSASPRYIFTRLARLTRHLFDEADDRLLNYLNEDGQFVEPDW